MNESIGTTSGTVGLDLGDRWSRYCRLDGQGEIVEQGRVATTREALERAFEGQPRLRIVLEVGTHSAWVSRLLASLGHEVLVANARALALISANRSKSDATDAELLARLGRVDPTLLRPIRHRRAATLSDRAVLRARDALVRARTALINHVRGAVKAAGGERLRAGPDVFGRKVSVPQELRDALAPVLEQLVQLSQAIGGYDARIEELCQTHYPQTQRLQQVPGVGPVTSLAYVLSIEDPGRFPSSRVVGSYLGLRPARSQSGERDPQLGITKEGDAHVRRLLVQAAQYILGPFGPDTDLRRFGLRLAERGGKAAKKRAVVAVARKLAVLLHRLWVSETDYERLHAASRDPATPASAA